MESRGRLWSCAVPPSLLPMREGRRFGLYAGLRAAALAACAGAGLEPAANRLMELSCEARWRQETHLEL